MRFYLTIIIVYLGTVICCAQIAVLPKATVKDVDPDPIPSYDSLSNFSTSSDFRYLKGQTLYLAKTSRLSSGMKSLIDKSSVDMKSIVGKYLLVEDVKGSKYEQSLILRDTASNLAYIYKMPTYNNSDWIVMGYYEKMKEKYVGKELILMHYDYTDILIYKDYPIYSLTTHKAISDIKLKTRWKCSGLSVDTELSDIDVKNRVIILLESDEYGQCYCYLTTKSDELNKNNEYKKDSYNTFYIAGKFMPGELYLKQQKQLQAKRQAEAEAEKKAQQQRAARQQAAAESNLKSLQKH